MTEAIRATFTRRGTNIPNDLPAAFTEEFYANSDKQIQWRAFLRTSKLEIHKIELPEVINDIQRFLMLPLNAVAENDSFSMKWLASGPWE